MEDLVEFLAEHKKEKEPKIQGLMFCTVKSIDSGKYTLTPISGHITGDIGPARLATMMVGDQFGTFFAPSVNDEVVVGFELGDLSQPVILGSLWNPNMAPPSQADTSQDNNKRTLVSRQKHQITFDDTNGQTRITIKSNAGYEIFIEDSPTPRIYVKTTGAIATSTLVLDGVMWNHIHPTGTGPSGPPQSLNPAAPEAITPEDQ